MLLLALAALLSVLVASGVAAEDAPATSGPPRIYKWIDENGVAHYTTDVQRIPRTLRERLGRTPERSDARQRPPEALQGHSPGLAERGFEQDVQPPLPGEEDWEEGETQPAQSTVVAELDRRIDRLEAEIAADEGALKALISDPTAEGPPDEEEAAALRELGDRLPKLLEELEALRAERAGLSP